jgi:hypothetical protein
MTREFDAYNKRKQTSYSRRVQEERRSLQWALSKVEDRLSLSGFISFCRRSKVLDIPPLAGLTSLIHLNMKGTDVDDISPLEGLTSVVHLDISNTDVDLTPPLPFLATRCPCTAIVHRQPTDSIFNKRRSPFHLFPPAERPGATGVHSSHQPQFTVHIKH